MTPKLHPTTANGNIIVNHVVVTTTGVGEYCWATVGRGGAHIDFVDQSQCLQFLTQSQLIKLASVCLAAAELVTP
jgi:hypothetical protein